MFRSSRKKLQPGQRIRVLIVDDSVVIRRLVSSALESEPMLEVVGTATHGGIALARIPQLNPDVITLDIEMPEMDGLETLRHLRRDYPDIRVVMFSTLTERGAAITLEALALGADDYVAKVSNAGSLDQSMLRLRNELIPRVMQFFSLPDSPSGAPIIRSAGVRVTAPVASPLRPSAAPEVVGIGISTGGPVALGQILPQFPAGFPVPILIVQHMPPMFTQLLAERLNATCALQVKEAQEGDIVEPGRILIAPGNFHMSVARSSGVLRIRLDQSAPQNSCRPAADVLFSSLAQTCGKGVLAAVLTGMGEDGSRGAGLIRAAGGTVIAQDEATSVVWGMPGAVVRSGLAHTVLPLQEIPGAIVQACSPLRGSVVGGR